MEGSGELARMRGRAATSSLRTLPLASYHSQPSSHPAYAVALFSLPIAPLLHSSPLTSTHPMPRRCLLLVHSRLLPWTLRCLRFLLLAPSPPACRPRSACKLVSPPSPKLKSSSPIKARATLALLRFPSLIDLGGFGSHLQVNNRMVWDNDTPFLEHCIDCLALHIGKKALASYIKKYAYSNTKTEGLWVVLEEETREPVKDLMTT